MRICNVLLNFFVSVYIPWFVFYIEWKSVRLELLTSIIYQKYLGTFIKVGCATRSLYANSGPKAEGVPTMNQRGRGSGLCRL